jgi:hypothetical protein
MNLLIMYIKLFYLTCCFLPISFLLPIKNKTKTKKQGYFSFFLFFLYYSLLILISPRTFLNFLKPTGYVMHKQFNIQQLYALSTLYLCVLYLSENKQRLVPHITLTDWVL